MNVGDEVVVTMPDHPLDGRLGVVTNAVESDDGTDYHVLLCNDVYVFRQHEIALT